MTAEDMEGNGAPQVTSMICGVSASVLRALIVPGLCEKQIKEQC